MLLSTPLQYDGNPRATADSIVELEKAGLDLVWVAEPYGFDSPTLMGYLAAKTETVEIGSAILNIYSRTPSAILQTAAGLDNVSQGRAILGLGAGWWDREHAAFGLPFPPAAARLDALRDDIRAAAFG